MLRFERILCPVDFFPASLRAFDYGVKLAANYEASVHALHVVAPVIPGAYGSAISVADVTTEMQAHSKVELTKLKTKALKTGVDVQTEVRVGDIDLEIRAAIRQNKADLLVMGTHGRRGFERWVMGSVTERLMRSCPIPLLAISSPKGAAAPPAIRHIVVTTDFSDGTPNAVAHAFSIAQESQSRITLLHVIDDVAITQLRVGQRGLLINEIREQLEEFVPEEARTWCDVETRVEIGTPYQMILKVLKSEKPGLLVMNVHGKGMIDRALIGSTAERVLRAAECPVLLVPSKAVAKKAPVRKGRSRGKVAA
jgi:nucleotide-binding universal stress UspA family protein